MTINVNVLLEQDRAKASIECANALCPEDLAKASDKAVGKARCRNETDAGRHQRAYTNGREELSTCGRDRVDHTTVLAGFLETKNVDTLLLEELVSCNRVR